MLDAIQTTAAPRATPTKASPGQKPEGDSAARFDNVYGKSGAGADRPAGDRSNESPERDAVDGQSGPEAGKAATAAAHNDRALIVIAPEGDAQVPEPGDPPVKETDHAAEPVPAELAELPPRAESQPVTELPAEANTIVAPASPEPTLQADEPVPEATADDPARPHMAPKAEGGEQNTAGGEGDDQPRERQLAREAAPRGDVAPARNEVPAERTTAARAEPTSAAAAARTIEAATPRAVEVAQPSAPLVDVSPAIAGSGVPQQTSPAQVATNPSATATAPATVVEQLAVAVRQSGDGRVDLTLSPVELGRVRLTLLAGETGITVAIRADRDDTLDLFRRNSDALAQEFRQLGYGSVGFQFSGGGNSGQSRNQDDDRDASALPEPAAPLPHGILRLTGLGGLDIRL
jgi:flagellar hook-length control protein FliK